MCSISPLAIISCFSRFEPVSCSFNKNKIFLISLNIVCWSSSVYYICLKYDFFVLGLGISSYENDTHGLVPGFQYCLNQAEAQVPEEKRSETPVYLGATAGMRLME